MTDVSSLNKEPVIEAAQGLYGTINSAFEDWDSKEVPPDGYEGLFGYNVPRQAVCDVQHDDKLDLRSLGIHDLSSQGRWHLSIRMQSAVGQLGISGLSVPLAGPRQRLIFQHKASSKDQFDAYIKNRDESYTSLSQVRRSYVHTLLSKAGVSVPESFDLNPAQRTLALAQIANRASVFEIAQRQSLPVHPTQEITFEKINSLTDPKQTARTIVQKVPLGMRSQQPKRPSYDTTLRAFYLQTDSDGKPLYSQTVTFEGTDARVALPVVQLDTYEVHPLTKTVATSRAKTNEHISLEMLEYIDAALFEAIYGGKRQRKLPHELA